MARKYTKRQTATQFELGQKVDTTALYIRVSTEKQADEGFSLDAQEKRLRAFCTAQEWIVDDKHIYVDAGVSGKSTDREQFQAMMQAAQVGEVTRIVAVKLDRVARNVKSFLHIVDELKAVGCDLVLIQESFDTSTPHGKFALTMFAAMAELEASTIAERMRTGKTEKASEGGYNGTRIPLGYTYADEQFGIAGDSADVVRSVFADFLAGQGLSAIAQRLNDTGATTAKGGQWYASTVRYILSNGFYAGLVQWGTSEDVAGAHPAIISRETYDHAQNRLNALRPGPAAEERLTGRYDEAGASHDMREVEQIALYYSRNPERYIQAKMREARQVIHQNWRHVDKVAKALLEHQTVDWSTTLDLLGIKE